VRRSVPLLGNSRVSSMRGSGPGRMENSDRDDRLEAKRQDHAGEGPYDRRRE